ncbi:maleylpyruvate isomerase family mycothiol-dependent enzyme [Antrihabitans spumae]|uniref:Maleylpyruvate isomerase family mycothiol-dependent enzyme n=1 Tax=Antrihabitans spumae TaxID=3373370 RepID=A0ABW7K4D4_9NOCA
MKFPNEDDLRRERTRFMTTIESLTDDEFENGTTLCDGWTPRDVLAHIVGTDKLSNYLKPSGLTISRGNAAMVRGSHELSRAELTAQGWAAADKPSIDGRMMAWLYAGDCAMHHQGVLRGLGKPHDVPAESAAAIFREGKAWRYLNAKPMRNRVIPTTPGGEPWGRGPEVHGTTEALALWMAGRRGIESELEFR